jgi:sodium/hydrogen exchanger 10/11
MLFLFPVGITGFLTGDISNGTVLVALDDAPVFATFQSRDTVRIVQDGGAVVAAGPPREVEGRAMAPIWPQGMVQLNLFSVYEMPGCARMLTGDNATHDETEQDHHDHHTYEILIFLFTIILVGTAILHLTTHHFFESLQFTVVVFILGILFAVVAENGGLDSTPTMFRSYQKGMTIDPHLVLFIFLPPLLCGDAMTIDTYVAKRRCWQCLLLAGPGVAIGSVLTALVIHYLLPYGWNFATSLTVGSILAATDPVAVVSLLKELGAAPGLTILIQGESLLNDGVAIVLFLITYDIVGGTVYTPDMVITFVLKNTLGAPVLGGTIGILTYLWIRSTSDKLCHSNPLIQICLTIACAYWSFILAEGVFKMSGVLSTVVAAFVLAHKMWPALVDRVAMLEIWHVIENIGNALVFTLAGMLTGAAMMNINRGIDFACAIGLYFAVTVIRFSMLICFRPLLNRLGQKVSLEESLVITWGGLRGMVGLALAILVKQDRANKKLSQTDGERILFLVGSIVTLTLVVNATTTSRLCNWLGILQASEGRKALIKNVFKRASADTTTQLQNLSSSKRALDISMERLTGAVERVIDAVGHHLPETAKQEPSDGDATKNEAKKHDGEPLWTHLPEADAAKLLEQFQAAKVEMLNSCKTIRKFQFGSQFEQIKQLLLSSKVEESRLKVVREVFLDVVREDYWKQVEAGAFIVGSPEFSKLIGSVNVALDRSDSGLFDWHMLRQDLYLENSDKQDLQNKGGGSGTWANLDIGNKPFYRRKFEQWQMERTTKRQTCAIQVIDAFVQAHTTAQSKIASYFGEDADVDSPEEAYVIIESEIQIFAAFVANASFHPKVLKRIATMWEARRLAEHFRQGILSAHSCGVLRTREVQAMLHPVGHAMKKLTLERKNLARSMSTDFFRRQVSGMTQDQAALRIQRAWKHHRSSILLNIAHDEDECTLMAI